MLINYRNVTLRHNEDPILEKVNFHIDRGEYAYIIGKVGSGKSSLLKSIYCELDINDAEEATVLGQDIINIKRKNVPALRREMGIVFQDFQLLHEINIYKNLDFVLKATGWKEQSKRQSRIEEVLDAVGMRHKINNMPHELSGGEQQRAAIARAILNKPKIIIADEPTGNLDPETAEGIANLLHEISETGTAVIMSTHNMQLVNNHPGIVYLCKDKMLTDVTLDYNKYIIND